MELYDPGLFGARWSSSLNYKSRTALQFCSKYVPNHQFNSLDCSTLDMNAYALDLCRPPTRFTQTHVQLSQWWLSAMQCSIVAVSCFDPQHQSFPIESQLLAWRWPKWRFQLYRFLQRNQGWISPVKGLFRESSPTPRFKASILLASSFLYNSGPSSCMTTGRTMTPWLDRPLLALQCLCSTSILSGWSLSLNKHLLISWKHGHHHIAMILEPK